MSEIASGTLQAPFDIAPKGIALGFDLREPLGAELLKDGLAGDLPQQIGLDEVF